MPISDDENGYARWARIMNKSHGCGGVFNHDNANDKRIVEVGTASDWCRSIAAEYGLEDGEPEPNPDDPPDCFVTIQGQRLGVELVQFIEQSHKARASKDETPYAGQLSEDMQWSKARFETRLNEVVQKKGGKYESIDILVDVLLIHTAEPWLSSSQVGQWLTEVEIKHHPKIRNAFLLMEYEPGRGVQHWPLFLLFGNDFAPPAT